MTDHGATASRNHAGALAMARCRLAKQAAAEEFAKCQRQYDLARERYDQEITRAVEALMAELDAIDAE